MKKKGLLRISTSLAVMILGGATLAGCGEENGTITPTPTPSGDVDTSVAKITNRDALLAEWGVNAGERPIQLTQSVAKIRTDGHTLEFVSSDTNIATVDNAGKVTPLAAGQVTITIKLDGAVADTIDLTFVAASYQSIESVTKAIIASNGDTTPVYSFRGVVTQLIATKAFTVQQGEYAIYIYANPEKAIEGHAIAVGDVLAITSTAQLYNGLIETKEIKSCVVLDETTETITAKTIQNKDLTDALQSVIVNVTGLKPVGALTPATSSAYGELQVTDDTSESKVTIYVNKYLPEATLTAINEKLNKLANEAFTANLNGVVVSKYNDFQYLVTDAAQIELVAAAAVNPTAVTISNVDDVKQLIVGKTAKLALTFAPDNCNAKSMTYTSSDPTVASIDADGKITALKVGTTKITATSSVVDTVKAEVDVTVIAPKFVTEPIVGEDYYFGMDCSAGVRYFNGEMSTFYGATVDGKDEAIKFNIVKGTGDNEGKFALKSAANKYIDITVGEYINFVYADEPAYLSYDKANFCYYKTVANKNYYFGTYSTYTTVSSKENVMDYPARLYPVYMADAPIVGSTIKLGSYHYNLTEPKHLYLDGTLSTTYFKTTDVEGSADIFTVEEGTTAERFALKTSAGKYLAREEQTNATSGSKYWAAILADAKSEATDFVWNAANMTFETIGANPGTCLGTSGTKTYETIGYSRSSYSDMVWMHAYLVDAPKGHGESATDPLTVAEALAMAGELADNAATEKVYYIKGKVAKIATAFDLGYGNISVYVTDDGTENSDTTKMFEYYRLTGLNGAKLMHESDIEVGDEVVTKAKIKKYVNSKNEITYETADSSPTIAITKANPALRAVAFDQKAATIDTNQSVTIKAGVAPTTLGKDASKITWTVSDDAKGTLDVTTGAQVVFTAKDATGEVTLTASYKENDSATPVTGTFKVTVVAPFSGAAFTFDGSMTPTVKSDAKVEWTDTTGAKFVIEQGDSNTVAGGSDKGVNQCFLGTSAQPEVRLYKNQKITFVKPSDKTISYIEVGVTNSNANYEGSTFTNGTNAKVSGSGNVGTSNVYVYRITPTDGTQDVSAIISKGACRFSYVKIALA